jgi:hypothetical protein
MHKKLAAMSSNEDSSAKDLAAIRREYRHLQRVQRNITSKFDNISDGMNKKFDNIVQIVAKGVAERVAFEEEVLEKAHQEEEKQEQSKQDAGSPTPVVHMARARSRRTSLFSGSSKANIAQLIQQRWSQQMAAIDKKFDDSPDNSANVSRQNSARLDLPDDSDEDDSHREKTKKEKTEGEIPSAEVPDVRSTEKKTEIFEKPSDIIKKMRSSKNMSESTKDQEPMQLEDMEEVKTTKVTPAKTSDLIVGSTLDESKESEGFTTQGAVNTTRSSGISSLFRKNVPTETVESSLAAQQAPCFGRIYDGDREETGVEVSGPKIGSGAKSKEWSGRKLVVTDNILDTSPSATPLRFADTMRSEFNRGGHSLSFDIEGLDTPASNSRKMMSFSTKEDGGNGKQEPLEPAPVLAPLVSLIPTNSPIRTRPRTKLSLLDSSLAAVSSNSNNVASSINDNGDTPIVEGPTFHSLRLESPAGARRKRGADA